LSFLFSSNTSLYDTCSFYSNDRFDSLSYQRFNMSVDVACGFTRSSTEYPMRKFQVTSPTTGRRIREADHDDDAIYAKWRFQGPGLFRRISRAQPYSGELHWLTFSKWHKCHVWSIALSRVYFELTRVTNIQHSSRA